MSAIAVDHQVLPEEGVFDELGYHPAIVNFHSRPVSVKDTHNSSIQIVVSTIGYRGNLRQTLSLRIN